MIPDIKTLHAQFIRECQLGIIKKRAIKTLISYQGTFNLLLKCFSITRIEQLSKELLIAFFYQGENKRKWQPATVLTHRKNLSGFITWCIYKGYLKHNPLDSIPTPRLIKKLPEYYSDEQIDKILYAVQMKFKLKFVRLRNRAIIATLLLTGLRKKELINLRITDLDFDNLYIRVRSETAKNRSPRVVAISPSLNQVLQEYWQERLKLNIESNNFWVSVTLHKPLTENGFKHMIELISDKIGFRLSMHKCRHTFATNLYKGGKDILAVKDALGHRDITTTMIYTQVIPEHTKIAIESNPLNNLF